MPTEAGTGTFCGGFSRRHILLLLLVSAVLDIVLLSRSIIISKDSVFFIDYAQSLDHGFSKTILRMYQHPGYPLLIRGVFAISHVLSNDPLNQWILSGQIASMICHWIGILCFYSIAKSLVGQKYAFICSVIFLFLPLPASLAIDALSDWPYLMFFLASLVFLIRGIQKNGPLDYLFTGFLAGLGYLVRPEAVQIIVYVFAWLGLTVYLKKANVQKVLILLLCCIAAFSVCALPYMIYKKAIFPKKNLLSPPPEPAMGAKPSSLLTASITFENRFIPAVLRILQRTLESLFYYFFPFALLGIWFYFRKEKPPFWAKYIVIWIILVNLVLLYLLYSNYGYVSKRHTLVICSVLILFIPAGLKYTAALLAGSHRFMGHLENHFFFAMLLIGIGICLPKLFRPLGYDKAHYIVIADKLKQQTGADAVIAVPDSRIGFYSQRRYYNYAHINKYYSTDAWVELLPDRKYKIHKGPYQRRPLPAKTE